MYDRYKEKKHLKVLSSEMDPAEILAKFARPPSIESPLKYESA
jgi:hypothetical protein